MTLEEIVEQVKELGRRVSALEMKQVDIQVKLDQIIASVADLGERVKKLEASDTETRTKLNLILWGIMGIGGCVITLLITSLLKGVTL